jgi:hypothetical protein
MSLPAAWIAGMMTSLEPSAPWSSTYDRTADAIAKLAEAEPLFEGDAPRTAALLVSVAWYESRLKPNAVSSNGRWVCLYQLDKRHLDDPKKALEDPETCTRAAMKILRASLASCAKRAGDERLAMFMSGTCDKGLPESRYRMFLAKQLLAKHPVPKDPARTASASASR